MGTEAQEIKDIMKNLQQIINEIELTRDVYVDKDYYRRKTLNMLSEYKYKHNSEWFKTLFESYVLTCYCNVSIEIHEYSEPVYHADTYNDFIAIALLSRKYFGDCHQQMYYLAFVHICTIGKQLGFDILDLYN